MAKGEDHRGAGGPRILNRKARHDFAILEVVECGMELLGTEVKSLRAGQAKIDDAYARVRGGQVVLVGANIAMYPNAAGELQHEPLRDRRLLLHRRQIQALEAHVRQKGKTLVPLAVYFKKGWAKCELGVAVGKRMFDKRQAIKAREQQRDIQREMTRRRKKG
jgi:SsrA-binding protein